MVIHESRHEPALREQNIKKIDLAILYWIRGTVYSIGLAAFRDYQLLMIIH